MYAYSYSRYGGPEVLEFVELPTPSPKASEVLIRVIATTVCSADWRVRSLTVPAGMGWIARLIFGINRPRKPILGTEFSGIVEQVGADVTEFKVGDAVIGFPGAGMGAHAEFIVMPSKGKIVPKPENIDFETAAAIPFGAITAYDYLINKGKIRAGERVLINGASGAVGSACVQIAKHIGAEVTGVCSAANADLVRRIGADHVIDYKAVNFENENRKYDVVVDTVGTAPWSRTRHALVPKGRMILISGKTSDMLFGALKARLDGKRMIGGVASEAVSILRKVVDLAAAGEFTPVIDRKLDFAQMAEAHAFVDSGRKRGNVVVRVAPSVEAKNRT